MKLIKMLTVKVSKPEKKIAPNPQERKQITIAGIGLCKSIINSRKTGSVRATFPTSRAA